MKGDVVRFVFNRKDFHFRSPSGASTAAITFITRVGNTSKRIVRGFGGVPGSADSILDHAAKAIELEGIEVRVSELERAAEAKKSGAMI